MNKTSLGWTKVMIKWERCQGYKNGSTCTDKEAWGIIVKEWRTHLYDPKNTDKSFEKIQHSFVKYHNIKYHNNGVERMYANRTYDKLTMKSNIGT